MDSKINQTKIYVPDPVLAPESIFSPKIDCFYFNRLSINIYFYKFKNLSSLITHCHRAAIYVTIPFVNIYFYKFKNKYLLTLNDNFLNERCSNYSIVVVYLNSRLHDGPGSNPKRKTIRFKSRIHEPYIRNEARNMFHQYVTVLNGEGIPLIMGRRNSHDIDQMPIFMPLRETLMERSSTIILMIKSIKYLFCKSNFQFSVIQFDFINN
jgi:hypothetical protein